MSHARIRIEFCGENYTPNPSSAFTIGREGDLSIDDNPFLHRLFLTIRFDHGLWWLVNTGSALSATVADGSGQVQAWLAPGAQIPLVFRELVVMFSAGSTSYDFTIHSEEDYYGVAPGSAMATGTTTVGPVPLTTSQRLLIIALAEKVLRQQTPGRGEIPSSADAAARLGWTQTAFNRKLDNVCDKLDRLGVPGLRGGRDKLATGRRARLVEYAVSTRLVQLDDLALLDDSPLDGDLLR